MKTVVIIQARMTSTRLPGKVLREVMGKPLLAYQLERLRRVRTADQIVIATTTNVTDEPIVEFCRDYDVTCFRGSEGDVLARYYGAALENHADTVIRVTSDCPLIDPEVVEKTWTEYATGRFDYVSNTLTRTYPRGMDTEVFSFAALGEAFREATQTSEHEHVTPFIYRHPERYRLGEVNLYTGRDESAHRWTVDTPEDLELITLLLEALYPAHPRFTLIDILKLLATHPAWSKINQHIEQKAH